MMMEFEVAEGERREPFIYPLVFIFCFEKWAELGGPRPGGEGTQDDGEVDLEDEASKAGGLPRNALPCCKRQAAEPDEYMIMPWLCQAMLMLHCPCLELFTFPRL